MPYNDMNAVAAWSHLDAFYGTETTSSRMTEASRIHCLENPTEEVMDSNTDSMDCDFYNETYD